jgi:hypothetical protein
MYIYICTYVYIHISEYIDLLELGTENTVDLPPMTWYLKIDYYYLIMAYYDG